MHASLHREHQKLKRDHNNAKYRFILTELDLAITFCDIALSSNGAKSRRNVENALQAYGAARYFLEDSRFSDRMKVNVEQKLLRLTTLLQQAEQLERNLATP
jgi:hypothetical protein